MQRNLLSMNLEKPWENMHAEQREKLINKVKAQAVVQLIQVNQYLQKQDFAKAKELLIIIGDSCSCIKEPDEQITKWLEFCCNYIAIFHKEQTEKKVKQGSGIEENGENYQQAIFMLKYDKFSGEFEFEKGLKQIPREVLHYVSKLNAILFSYQNIQNCHCLSVILQTYWISFLMSLGLIIVLLVFFINHINDQDGTYFVWPLLSLNGLFILPMLMIYCKEPLQRKNFFFNNQLSKELTKINEESKRKKQRIEFKMPNQLEINVIIKSDSQVIENDCVKT